MRASHIALKHFLSLPDDLMVSSVCGHHANVGGHTKQLVAVHECMDEQIAMITAQKNRQLESARHHS